MVQEIKEGYEASERTYARHVFQENVAIVADPGFTGVLFIDARRVRESVIQFYNFGAQDLTYKVFATARYDPALFTNGLEDPSTIDPDAANTPTNPNPWINLLSIIAGQTGTDYVHTTTKPVNAGLRFYESFSNQWFGVLVQVQSTVGTDLNLWHRGQS